MYKGIYIALSGAVLKHTQIEIISRNLANADTTGYKKELATFKDYLVSQSPLSGPDGRIMTNIASVNIDFSSGTIFKTGNQLDIAIDGRGFIALEGNRYTKRGDMRRDVEGYLTAYNGVKVLGSKGPIKLPVGKVEINEEGDIFVNGSQVDTIRVLDFQNEDISKTGDGTFFTNAAGIKSKSIVKQGHIEKSNVDVIKEMAYMIETMREFEAYQKVIQTFDEAASKVTNEMARI